MRFDPAECCFTGAVRLGGIVPLVNGEPAAAGTPAVAETPGGWSLQWQLAEPFAGASFQLLISPEFELSMSVTALSPEDVIDSFGVRFAETGNVRAYLRMGYQSWDGTFFVEPEALAGLCQELGQGAGGGLCESG